MLPVGRAGFADLSAWDACEAAGTAQACEQLCLEAFPGVGILVTCELVTLTDGGRDAQAVVRDAGPDAHDDAITLHIVRTTTCGRRPAGLEGRRGASCGSIAGRWLARAAELEAASVS